MTSKDIRRVGTIAAGLLAVALGALGCQPISTAYGGRYVDITPAACVQPSGGLACAVPGQQGSQQGSDPCTQACAPGQSDTIRR